MIGHLLLPMFIIICFICLRSLDLSVSYGQARSYLKAVLYGAVGFVALIYLVQQVYG